MCVEKTPWEQVVDFHGHTCPGIALGFRVAQIAQRELGLRPAPSAELLVKAETQSCALDAFQILNKATCGRGTLQIKEKGKHVYSFQYSGTDDLVRVALKGDLLARIAEPASFTNPRQRQNWVLETIQFILACPEEEFCTVRRTPAVLYNDTAIPQWTACSVCGEAVRTDHAVQTGEVFKCLTCAD
ncbi:FmdE, molybdenum formylmethanofuran dehydrogenase operon [Peptococcaceae bacterium CEB3]|nr:FmdE, molybdenum formylmethanofuran dehydrogenase operon [Peptococcaceae bacterium CEB3]